MKTLEKCQQQELEKRRRIEHQLLIVQLSKKETPPSTHKRMSKLFPKKFDSKLFSCVIFRLIFYFVQNQSTVKLFSQINSQVFKITP